MPNLSFIPDSVLIHEVKHLLDIAQTAMNKADKDFERNVIDPFTLLFEMAGFGVNSEDWQRGEKNRQIQKTLSNHVGIFHQRILGSVEGWKDLGTGGVIDLQNGDRKIIAEIKNKYNTVKGSDKVKIYDHLETMVMTKGHQYKGFTAYYVEIIPKNGLSYDKEFTPSDSAQGQQRKHNPLIRLIDGFSFYDLVTGENNALGRLFSVLPDVVEELSDYRYENRNFLQKFFKSAFHHCQTK